MLFLASLAQAQDCSDIADSGDGVPAEYFIEECKADAAFKAGEYTSAAKHYQQASGVLFHEAPNYLLRVRWAESLCLSGQPSQGLTLLDSFQLAARADIGEIECPADLPEDPWPEHIYIACLYANLTGPGQRNVRKLLDRAADVTQMCSATRIDPINDFPHDAEKTPLR